MYEAINRLYIPQHVDGEIMFIVACCGIVVNIVMQRILHSHSSNVNVRSAFIHVFGDLIQSIGVLIAAALTWYDNKTFYMIDPICTVIFLIIVVFTTYNLTRDILSVLMEAVPSNVNYTEIISELKQLSDVSQVNELHIWNLSINKPVLSAHLFVKSSSALSSNHILGQAQTVLKNKFGIHHSTIQIEWPHNMEDSRKSCPSYCEIYNNNKNNNNIAIEDISQDNIIQDIQPLSIQTNSDNINVENGN